MSYSLNSLYDAVGISKQAVHKAASRQLQRESLVVGLTKRADALRKDCGGMGIRAMYDKMKPQGIGRDRFELLMADLGYKLKKHRAYHRTTRPGTRVFPNLIEGMVLHPHWQVW